MDIVAATKHNNLYWINDGAGIFARSNIGDFTADGGRSRDLVIADMDGDSDLDIAVANQNNERNFLYFNDGYGLFQRVLKGDFVKDTGISYGLEAADIDGDGRFLCNVTVFVPALYRSRYA